MTIPRRIVPFLLIALVAALAVAPGASAKSKSKRAKGPHFRGIQVLSLRPGTTAQHIRDHLDLARRLRANVVRTEILWSAFEPTPGTYDPASVGLADTFMREARARHLKVLVTVLSTPCWTTTAPAPDCATADGRADAAKYPPADAAAFGRVSAFIAGRYKSDLAGFEVWNEPDQVNQLYFAGPDKVRRYVALMKAAYPAVKAAAPKVPVLGGGFVGGNGKFLEALYAEGFKGTYDILSVHFYDLVLLSLRDIRAIQARHGDRKPVWLAEFGWPSCAPRHRRAGAHICLTRSWQARSEGDVFRALAMKRGRFVRGAIVYTLQDSPGFPFGAVDLRARPKPVFKTLRAAFLGRLGAPRKVGLKLRTRGGRVTASGSGPVADAYEMNVWQGRTLRYRVAFRLSRTGRYSIRLPRALGTRNLTVQVFQYWLGSKRGAVRRT
jgi:polysaccharide biosynthesis protein PslG